MTNRFFDTDAAWALLGHLRELDEDDRPEDPMEIIRERATVVGRQEWDSGGPGAGAGQLVVYRFKRKFFAEDDVESLGPFDSFDDAAEAVGLFRTTSATVSIWLAKGLKRRMHG